MKASPRMMAMVIIFKKWKLWRMIWRLPTISMSQLLISLLSLTLLLYQYFEGRADCRGDKPLWRGLHQQPRHRPQLFPLFQDCWNDIIICKWWCDVENWKTESQHPLHWSQMCPSLQEPHPQVALLAFSFPCSSFVSFLLCFVLPVFSFPSLSISSVFIIPLFSLPCLFLSMLFPLGAFCLICFLNQNLHRILKTSISTLLSDAMPRRRSRITRSNCWASPRRKRLRPKSRTSPRCWHRWRSKTMNRSLSQSGGKLVILTNQVFLW